MAKAAPERGLEVARAIRRPRERAVALVVAARVDCDAAVLAAKAGLSGDSLERALARIAAVAARDHPERSRELARGLSGATWRAEALTVLASLEDDRVLSAEAIGAAEAVSDPGGRCLRLAEAAAAAHRSCPDLAGTAEASALALARECPAHEGAAFLRSIGSSMACVDLTRSRARFAEADAADGSVAGRRDSAMRRARACLAYGEFAIQMEALSGLADHDGAILELLPEVVRSVRRRNPDDADLLRGLHAAWSGATELTGAALGAL